MEVTVNIYNELQVLRAKRKAIHDEMVNMKVAAHDLDENSKERNLLRAQYKIRRLGLEAMDVRIASLVKEVSCEV